MAIIDFHSHILPGIDDGSRDTATSSEMLRRMAGQGVDTVIATPHFYAERDRMEAFLSRRAGAYGKLKAKGGNPPVKLLLGAETAFFPGISRAERLDLLAIEGTDMLLLEMPFAPWRDSDIEEVRKVLARGFRVMLAHLERYLDLPGGKRRVEEICALPVSVQVNAGSLLDWRKRRQVLHMFQRDEAHVLGSDCHGMGHRPPNLLQGREVLEKKLGAAFLSQMDEEGGRLLKIERQGDCT